MTLACVDPAEPGGPCLRCGPCVAGPLQRASQSLSGVYGRAVQLSLQGCHVVASPSGLPPRRPARPSGPESEAWIRALAREGGADAVAAALRRRDGERGLRLAAELGRLAEEQGGRVEHADAGAVEITLRSGACLRVRIDGLSCSVDGRSQTASGLRTLRSTAVAELALDGRLSAPQDRPRFLGALLAGEQPHLEPWERGLIERLGVLDDDPHAAWLRAELGRYVAHGATPGGLGSPVAMGGVTYANHRILSVDGVPMRHVDVEALSAWRRWASRRTAERRHSVAGYGLKLGWVPVTWGAPGRPNCDRLPFAGDGPEPARAHFERHRRMYTGEALPPVNRKRPPTNWGRAGTPLPLDPPRRSRGRARALYEPIIRHWLVGWSMSEIAQASGVSRSAVGRLVASAMATSTRARRAFVEQARCSYAGHWLAVTDGQVVVTETWSGDR